MSEDIKNNEYDPGARSSFSPVTKAEQNQKIADSVTMILKVAFEQRERLVTLLNDGNPHNDISQKEFDRVNIIINALCPMMHHNTGKEIYAKHPQENVKN